MGMRIAVQSLWPSPSDTSTLVYEFAQSRVVIGRSRSADVQLPHEAVSAVHASIHAKGSGYVLVDEGSTNGTRVNESPLVPGRTKALRPNDVIELGGYRLSIEVGIAVAQTMSARLTADFAKRMLAERLGVDDRVGLDARLAQIQSGPDEAVDLLPILEEVPSQAPPPPRSQPPPSRSPRPGVGPIAAKPSRLGRSELVVYALAALVVATSVVAMALLMRS